MKNDHEISNVNEQAEKLSVTVHSDQLTEVNNNGVDISSFMGEKGYDELADLLSTVYTRKINHCRIESSYEMPWEVITKPKNQEEFFGKLSGAAEDQ